MRPLPLPTWKCPECGVVFQPTRRRANRARCYRDVDRHCCSKKCSMDINRIYASETDRMRAKTRWLKARRTAAGLRVDTAEPLKDVRQSRAQRRLKGGEKVVPVRLFVHDVGRGARRPIRRIVGPVVAA